MAATGDGMEGEPAYYHCACKMTESFFVRSANLAYFSYDGDDADFAKQYNEAIRGAPADAELFTLEEALADVKRQQEVRRRSPQESSERAKGIAEKYTRLHPHVYKLDVERFLDPSFRQLIEALQRCKTNPLAVKCCVDEMVKSGLLRVMRDDIFCFPVFSEEFCVLLDEELRNFEKADLPRTAPNTMNRFGVIMRELGFSSLLDPLVFEFVDPIARKLLPAHMDESLDSYRAFTVQYEQEKDQSLSLHYDNAEVTLNVNIGGDWGGGQVSFFELLGCDPEKGPPKVSVNLERGHGVLHSARVMHQADPVLSGRRENLILWCRSSGFRNEHCPMCSREPRCVPTNEFINEGFTVPPCRLYTSS
eukprot:TRINITY_DN45340_c0_g1_i1.p1 TRINITY_DN45340_c0_g1~~TRINITY_DN45340_c0_g1_i1.p1  ORF type:complete len:386 (-),score=60.98 TRINITY_DN45340_c0_g1_i1:38-1126(-)